MAMTGVTMYIKLNESQFILTALVGGFDVGRKGKN